MDLFAQRALTPVRAAKRQVTLDTTPTKKATKRWAARRAAEALGLNLSGQTTASQSWSWSSRSKWKKRLMLPCFAASQRLMWSPVLVKQPAANIIRPASALPTARVMPLLPHPLPEWKPFRYLLGNEGPGILLLQRKMCAFALDLPQDFVWTCVLTFLFPFFKTTSYLYFCVWHGLS